MRKKYDAHPEEANADVSISRCEASGVINMAIAQRLRRLSKDVFDSFACRLRMMCLLFQQFC